MVKLYFTVAVGTKISLEVQPNDSIAVLKKMLHEKIGQSLEHYNLMIGGKTLSEKKTISCSSIKEGDMIYAVSRI